MENLIIASTLKTPGVKFMTDGELSISGKSCCISGAIVAGEEPARDSLPFITCLVPSWYKQQKAGMLC